MLTYREKVEKIFEVQEFLINKLKGIGIENIFKCWSDLTRDLSYPAFFVLFVKGVQNDIREKENCVLEFNILIKNKSEEELNNYLLMADIVELFEQYNYENENIIGLKINFPENFFNSNDNLKTIGTVLTVQVEI
jgi:hypothetical protein